MVEKAAGIPLQENFYRYVPRDPPSKQPEVPENKGAHFGGSLPGDSILLGGASKG